MYNSLLAVVTTQILLSQLIRSVLQRRYDWIEITGDTIATMSAGVAAGPFTNPRQLVEAADRCLYDAKDAGRDRVVAVASSPSTEPTV